MAAPSDAQSFLPRSRLCDLAKVERGKHLRWLKEGFLPKREAYGLRDVQRAAMLGALCEGVGTQQALAIWPLIEGEIGIPGAKLEVIIELSTGRPSLVRSDRELAEVLPRNEALVVIDLAARAREADVRARQHLAALHSRQGTVDRGKRNETKRLDEAH